MKYKLYVLSIDGDYDKDGDYDDILYDDLAEATYAKHIADRKHPECMIAIVECCERSK